MLNVQMYTQMGYTEAQVRKAYEFSQKNKIDMFDALQKLQNQDYNDNQKKLQINVPSFSYLNNIKNIKLNEYEIMYSRYGVKESPYARDQLREINVPVGLFNVSNCCYLNSLLQCYFLMGAFVKEILSAQEINELPQQLGNKIKRIKNEYLLLNALKQIFAKMKLSSKRYIDPTPVLKNLVNSVGQKIQYGDEKDLNQINMEIVQRLSQCLMYTKKYYSRDGSPSKIKKRENIKQFFYGEKVQFIQGLQGQSIVDFMGIILNPKHDDLLTALDAQLNYDVEIDGKIMRKHTFIRSLPNYLFFTISRTQFHKKGNQILKNSQKISFDFVIYLDQFLEQNRQQGKIKNPKIKQLQNKKNAIKSQLYHFDLLTQKLQECRTHAKHLQNWIQKIPKEQELNQQKKSFKRKIQQIQQQLSQIESRKQKYVLMYLFVHRGDAISGHYWGYGRNGNYWYRFDVNCVPIKQVNILVDMEKSAGIPYAMVYVKQNQIQSFSYPYYTDPQYKSNLLEVEEKQDYADYISTRYKTQIINQNITMHQSIEKQKMKNTIQNIIKDYKAKFSIVKSETEKYMKSQKDVRIPSYMNFACFLESNGYSEFMKYNIFTMALASKAQMNCSQLLQDQKLLKSLQHSFKKKVKGKMNLRHFALECQPGQSVKYKQASSQYLIGKKCLQFIRLIYIQIKQWPQVSNFNSLLQQVIELLKTNDESVYLICVVRQVIAIMLLDMCVRKLPLKLDWADVCSKQNPLLKDQLIALGAVQLKNQEINAYKASFFQRMQIEKSWSLQSLKRGFEYDVLPALKQIISNLDSGMTIYKANTKENKILNDRKLFIQSQQPIEKSEDLI